MKTIPRICTSETNCRLFETSGFFYARYCELNVKFYECKRFFDTGLTGGDKEEWELNLPNGTMKSNFSVKERIEEYIAPGVTDIEQEDALYEVSIYRLDKKQVVFQGNYTNQSSLNVTPTLSGYKVVVGDTKSAEAGEGVENLLYDTIIPALLIILGLTAAVTIAVLGTQIIKSSDEASERSEKIKQLRNILIGLAIAFIILFAIEPVSELVNRLMENG